MGTMPRAAAPPLPPTTPSDYSHRWHVGNHGDVWKHVAWCAVLDALRPTAVLDTHAGEGGYTLGPTGEWTAGVGRLWSASGAGADPSVRRYLDALAALGTARLSYPGSPQLALHLLGPDARWRGFELQADAARVLQGKLADARAEVVVGDGYGATGGEELALIDPPYVERDEWSRAPDALLAHRGPGLLWYPIKSWSRPNVLLQRLRDGGIGWTALDLVVTPLELKRPQLAGSGVVLTGAARAVVGALCAAASALGPALATHDGRWSLRVTAQQ